MTEQAIHWADKIAELVKQRVENNSQLKEVVEKEGYIVYDEKTPSGTIHVGSARGWVMHDCVAKALRKIGLNAKFVLSSDDMDPYDKPNKELDSSWDKYLGMAFIDIPSPVDGYRSFADYYFTQVTEKFSEWGIESELESTGEKYKSGAFNKQIKTILDNTKKVQSIYEEMYGEDTPFAKKLPFNVKCPKCGKIATTRAIAWDKDKEEIEFECNENEVKFAKGCGYKGKISPYNGNGKFPWKVEWPSKWPMRGVIYEIAGKDHFSKGGSRSIANRIAVDVLGYPPPLPSDGYREGKGYEFFTVGGAKMSTSGGRGYAFRDITQYAPAQMLRYLIVKTRPNAVIDFDPYNDNDLILLYERYDQTEKAYFEGSDNAQKRIYELSHVGDIKKSCPLHIALNSAAVALQIAVFDKERAIEVLKKQGLVPIEINGEQKNEVITRLEFAEKWVKEFASDQYKFDVNQRLSDEVKSMLDEEGRGALKLISQRLAQNEYDEKSLHEEFYKIKDELGIDTKTIFKNAYRALINKEKGPRLASFILAVGKDKIINLFNQL